MRSWKSTAVFLAGLVAGGILIGGVAFKKNDSLPEAEKPEKETRDRPWEYKWYPPELPESIDFAGETVPLDRWEVRERLDRDLLVNTYLHGTTLYSIKLANRVFPVIEERLRANGVPEDFKFLCVAESQLQNLISPAGAVGYWQFLKDTGIRYGLEINGEVDERYHLEKSTDAACRYLKDAYQKFGSWTAAAASYNCGTAGYNRYSSYQQTRDYYDLLLPEETNRYIFRILALKYLLSDPERMGFITEEQDVYKPVPTRTVEIRSSIDNLAEYAISQNTSYKMLKVHNPWLRDHSLMVKPGKTYTIRLPAE